MTHRAVLAVMVGMLFPIASFAQSTEFDAITPVTFSNPSIDGCLYNTVSGPIVASVSMAPGAVGLTLHFPALQLQRTFGNPACAETRTLNPADASFSLPRHVNNVFIQYSLEIDRDGVTDILGVGGVGRGHILLQVYFCAEDNQPTCTWTRTVTNRVLVSLYYRFYKESPSSILGFFGQYLGPNPGPLSTPTITSAAVLPQGFVSEPYGPFKFTAIGGTPPYTWRALTITPPFLDVQPDGSLTGTPELMGDHRFTVTARDAVGLTAAKEFVLPVADTRPVVITSSPLLPAANVGSQYSASICAQGGTPPYQWSGVVPFPPGLHVTNSGGQGGCGVLTGVPQLAVPIGVGEWPPELTPTPIFITATDSRGRKATKTFALQVTQLPNVEFKTPSVRGQLYGKALLQLTTGVLASVIGAVYCPPAIPACWKFTAVVAGALITPGMYDLLAAMDPPDPQFTTIIEPQVRHSLPRLVSGDGLPAQLTEVVNQLAGNGEQRIALADAFRATIDKAQGAIQAGDQCWAGGQLHTAERYAQQLADLTAAERQHRASLRAMLAGLPQMMVSAAELSALQQEVATTGFPSMMSQFLSDAGVDQLTRDRLRYLLKHAQVDLPSAAGSYGFDAAGTGPTLASAEDEQAWRSFANARGSAQYPCADAGLTLSFNATSFSAPADLAVTARLLPAAAMTQPVDAYIVVQLPTGQLLSVLEHGGVVAGIVPFFRSRAPYTFNKTVLTYSFNGSEPSGVYTWHAVLTQPGTLNFVAPPRLNQFTVP